MRTFFQRKSLCVKFVARVAAQLAAIAMFLLAFFPARLDSLAVSITESVQSTENAIGVVQDVSKAVPVPTVTSHYRI
jgi:hypothetical protein